METIIKNTVRTRLMLAKAYAKEGWTELARTQLELLKRELAAYRAEKTVILEAA